MSVIVTRTSYQAIILNNLPACKSVEAIGIKIEINVYFKLTMKKLKFIFLKQ